MNIPDWYFEIKYTLVYFNRVRVSVSHSIETGSKQRRRKNKSTKISVWFKVKKVLEKQQWEDHRVCSQSRNWVIIRYVLVILNSQYKKDWKGGHNFCLKIHDKLDLMLLFLARLNESSYIFLFSYKTIRWVLMF